MLLAASLILAACAASPTATPAPVTEAPAITETVDEPVEEAPVEPQPEAEPITLTDGLGREVSLPGPAQRVISIAPSNTEILFAVGAGGQMVGRDEFSDYPPEAQEITNIGGKLGELDPETLLAQEPDLVLASQLTPAEQIQSLENVGLVVYALPNPTEIEGLYENLRVVGRLTGHEEEAETLIAELQERVAAVEEKVATAEERPLVFYELDSTDPSAPWTAGPGTFIETIIEMAGGENVGSTLQGDYAQISIENLLVEDPDVIILGDYTWGGVTPEDVVARSGWQELSAVQNGRVYTFDDNLISRPGPRLVDGLEEMARLLHPGLFE